MKVWLKTPAALLGNVKDGRLLRRNSLLITVLAVLSSAAHSQTLKTYVIKDLGSLGGESRAMGVNLSGHTVGYYLDGQLRQRPFLFHNYNGLSDLGSFNGASGSGIAYGINDSGIIVGYATNAAANKRAFRTGAYSPINPLTDDLGTLGGVQAEARSISNSGFIVGSSTISNGRWRAFRYAPGDMRNLGILDNGNGQSWGLSVNEMGQAAGHSDKNTQHGRAFRYNGDLPVTLQELGLTVRDSEGASINNLGDIVGTQEQGSAINGFLFQDGQSVANLGSNVVAKGINDTGTFVGEFAVGADIHGFVNYGNGNIDLWDMISGPEMMNFIGTGKSLGATAISQSGTIVGWADGLSGRHAVKMVPYAVQLQKLTPPSVDVGGPTFTVTADGWGFSRACLLYWNGTPLSTTFVSGRRLTAIVPASLIATVGTGTVTVGIPTVTGESNAMPLVVGPYNVSATPNAVPFGGSINVNWSVPGAESNLDWVGLFRVGDDNRQWIAYAYTNGAASGSTTFTAPAVEGQYEVRYLVNNGYESRGVSAPITVSARQGFSVSTSASTVSAGQWVSVSWTAPSGRPAVDWIGLYAAGADNRQYISWIYTGGAVSGTTAFAAPAQAGTYEFRYLLDNGWDDSARSSSFTVSP